MSAAAHIRLMGLKEIFRQKHARGVPIINGGWFAKDAPGEPSAFAIAAMYAQREDEHTSAGALIDRDYDRYLAESMPAPRGRRVTGKDVRMWSGVSFVSSIPVVMSLASAAVITPAPLLVAATAAALPVAGIALRNAVLGHRVTKWEQKTVAKREHDRPRVDGIKTMAYVEARKLQNQRWATTEAAVAELRHDVAA